MNIKINQSFASTLPQLSRMKIGSQLQITEKKQIETENFFYRIKTIWKIC